MGYGIPPHKPCGTQSGLISQIIRISRIDTGGRVRDSRSPFTPIQAEGYERPPWFLRTDGGRQLPACESSPFTGGVYSV